MAGKFLLHLIIIILTIEKLLLTFTEWKGWKSVVDFVEKLLMNLVLTMRAIRMVIGFALGK